VLFQSLLLGESTWLPSHFDKPLPTKISVQLGEPPQYFKIAFECGWEMKLDRMVRETPFLHFIDDGNTCQSNAKPVCVVEPISLSVHPVK
jgi:hypothetical protein